MLRLSKKPVIARRPNGPTWQSVPKTHEYQHIPDFLVTDSHVAALLGMTEKGLSTRCNPPPGGFSFYPSRPNSRRKYCTNIPAEIRAVCLCLLGGCFFGGLLRL